MEIATWVEEERASLLDVAEHAIVDAAYEASKRAKAYGKKRKGGAPHPEEPDLTATLALHGAWRLWSGWNSILNRRGLSLAVKGIYCHQKPKVTIMGGSKKSCELGDLLVCHVHKQRDAQEFRSALLLQAKMSSGALKAKPEDPQFELYSLWPEFEYAGFEGINSMSRIVRPSAPRRGAQYLMIDGSLKGIDPSAICSTFGKGRHPMHVAMAHSSMTPGASLAEELVGMLSLKGGEAFDDRESASKGQDWSTMVWDLVDGLVDSRFTRTNIGFDSGNRQPRRTGFAAATHLMAFHCLPEDGPILPFGPRGWTTTGGPGWPESPVDDELGPMEGGLGVILMESATHEELRPS